MSVNEKEQVAVITKNTEDKVLTSYDKHREKCIEMFEKPRKNGEEFYVFFERIYRTTDNYATVILDILTNDMIEYDREQLNPENTADGYRPYFAWFRFKVDNKEAEEYSSRIGNWYTANFVKLPKGKFKQKPEQDSEDEDSFVTERGKNGEIPGWYEYSASPIKSFIEWINLNPAKLPQTEFENIINNYPCPAANDVPNMGKELDNFFSKVDLKTSRVFKVGNGNLISLEGTKQKNDFTLLFDIGYHSDGSPRNQYNPATNSLKSINPSGIIISHWDLDHYLGVVYASDSIFNCPWFAPGLDDHDGANVRRLVSCINKKSQIYLVEKGDSEEMICSVSNSLSTISVYRGSGKGDRNKKNSKGLVITVNNKVPNKGNIRTLFHADVPYRAVSSLVWKSKSYDILVAPHHGARCNPYKDINPVQAGVAVICCDNNLGQRHQGLRPHQHHVEALKNRGYTVYVTEDPTTKYELDLCGKKIV